MVSEDGNLEDEVKSSVWFVLGFVLFCFCPWRHFSANAFTKCNIAALLSEL